MTGESPRTDAPQHDELGPVKESLLAVAQRSADRVLDEARRQSSAVLLAARREADGILADARAQGAEQARVGIAADLARARREARATVLAAQLAAYDRVAEGGRSAVRQVMTDPASAAGLEAIAGSLRRQLGNGARVDSVPEGGLIAEGPGRRIDLSAAALVDRALEELGGDIGGLWAP